jgi:hypothetical protein
MHAIGHVAANLSFAAVAISLTHTVKTLEPAFNVVLSRVRTLRCTSPLYCCAHVSVLNPCRLHRPLLRLLLTPQHALRQLISDLPTCPACLPLQLLMGTSTPLPVVGSLIPIMLGVAMASAAELTFNWTGFLTAMMSNLTFGFRAVWSKK